MKTYTVNINGIDHTMQLSDEDAAARGLTADEPKAKQADAPRNKARKTASTKRKG